MQLLTTFAVPMGIMKLESTEQLNKELAEFFSECAKKDEYSNKHRNSIRQKEVFESSFDLFGWQEPCIQKLKSKCMNALLQFTGRLSNISNEEIKEWQVFCDAWFHVTKKGGYFTAHNHPNASWSAVYCVQNEVSSTNTVENGVLRFLDYKSHSTMYIDAANNRLPEPFNLGNRVFNLSAGDFIIFPSYLLHEVSPYWGETERITVAMNCWFKDRRINYPG